VYLFFLRSSGLTTFIFFIPKEFSRRRIRHPAVGLGSWQCTQKNDLIVHYQVCKAPKVPVIRIVYRWLARTDTVYRVGVFVVAVTQCNSRHFMQQHACALPACCLLALLAFGFGFRGSRSRIYRAAYGTAAACGYSRAEGGAMLRCKNGARQVASSKWRWWRAESGAVCWFALTGLSALARVLLLLQSL
jgi:hypothetical protein